MSLPRSCSARPRTTSSRAWRWWGRSWKMSYCVDSVSGAVADEVGPVDRACGEIGEAEHRAGWLEPLDGLGRVGSPCVSGVDDHAGGERLSRGRGDEGVEVRLGQARSGGVALALDGADSAVSSLGRPSRCRCRSPRRRAAMRPIRTRAIRWGSVRGRADRCGGRPSSDARTGVRFLRGCRRLRGCGRVCAGSHRSWARLRSVFTVVCGRGGWRTVFQAGGPRIVMGVSSLLPALRLRCRRADSTL